jgi:hypothetical protein
MLCLKSKRKFFIPLGSFLTIVSISLPSYASGQELVRIYGMGYLVLTVIINFVLSLFVGIKLKKYFGAVASLLLVAVYSFCIKQFLNIMPVEIRVLLCFFWPLLHFSFLIYLLNKRSIPVLVEKGNR